MFITEGQISDLNKVQQQSRELNKLIPLKQLKQIIRKLEASINVESPRTQKAMNNLELTKFNLIRRNPQEFKIQENDEKKAHQDYVTYLHDYKDSLEAVLKEREEVKRQNLLRQRQLEEFMGIPPSPPQQSLQRKEPDLEPVHLGQRLDKIDKERQREKQISDQIIKQELFNELRRRQTLQKLEEKMERIMTKKEEKIIQRLQKTAEQNKRIRNIFEKQKQKQTEIFNENFRESQNFHEKFVEREQKLQEQREKSLEQLLKKKQDLEEKVYFKKQKILHSNDQYKEKLKKKDDEHQIRYQMKKNETQVFRSQKKEENELILQQKQKSAQMQQSFAQIEYVNNFWLKMDKANVSQSKREAFISQFLKDHKKAIEDRFVRQKKKMERNYDNEGQRIEKIKEELQEEDEQTKKLYESRSTWLMTKSQQTDKRLQRQQTNHDIVQFQKSLKEDQLLQKFQERTGKLQSKKSDHMKLLCYSNDTKVRMEMKNILMSQEIQKVQQIPTEVILQKFTSLGVLKNEDLDEFRQTFTTTIKEHKSTAHKTSRSSSQQYFKRPQ